MEKITQDELMDTLKLSEEETEQVAGGSASQVCGKKRYNCIQNKLPTRVCDEEHAKCLKNFA